MAVVTIWFSNLSPAAQQGAKDQAQKKFHQTEHYSPAHSQGKSDMIKTVKQPVHILSALHDSVMLQRRESTATGTSATSRSLPSQPRKPPCNDLSLSFAKGCTLRLPSYI